MFDLPGGADQPPLDQERRRQPDGTKLYATVGSNSNVGDNGMENEAGRAAIWEYDIATAKARIFASGIRNPNGIDFEPTTGAMWTVSNERDEIGNDLPPDFLTSVKDGGFYGWPWSYWGQNVDKRAKPANPEMVAKAIAPDFGLGPHTASLGLAFYTAAAFPASYRGGAFIGQHGSWNRKPLERLPGGVRPLRRRPAAERAAGLPDRLPGQARQDPGPAGRRRRSTRPAPCWWPTTSAASSGGSAPTPGDSQAPAI